MKVREIMTVPAVTVSAETSVIAASVRMRDHGVGALPVLQDQRLIGIVTDRDIAVELSALDTAQHDRTVADIMTPQVISCAEDEDVSNAAAMMGDNQIRRLAVLDDHGKLKGVLSIGDIAVNASERLAGETLGEIAEDR